ncbi:MAG: PH domain-containing protein [Planctomycetaceae bacterium]|nr:PH domain-containing protein [Planctomycetaceae bacterium]
MATLNYRCPNCGASHEVDEALVGDRVDCRKCGRPFEAAMPVARPSEGEATGQSEYRVAAGEGEVEDTILQVHPAMARKHPFRFLGICLVVIAGLAAMVIGAAGGAALPGNAPPMVLLASGAVIAALGAVYWLVWWAQTRFTMLTITSRRSTLRRGLIARETSEVQHRDVRNLQINQTTLERLLGVGDIAISSAGQDGLEIHVEGIPHPEKVAAVVRDMQS